jgi:predicted nucleotidyltransferase
MQLPVDKIRELCKKHGIMVFILFGSYAANRFDSESDVDVAILVKNPVSILKSRTRILKKLSDLFGYKDIDLVLLNHADPLLKFNIARGSVR